MIRRIFAALLGLFGIYKLHTVFHAAWLYTKRAGDWSLIPGDPVFFIPFIAALFCFLGGGAAVLKAPGAAWISLAGIIGYAILLLAVIIGGDDIHMQMQHWINLLIASALSLPLFLLRRIGNKDKRQA